MRIAVLFDGAGLARLGLEKAGHDCTGYELNPVAHRLSKSVGSGKCILADVRDVDYSEYEGAWCSPPCQRISSARTQGPPISPYSDNLLDWSLSLAERFPNLKTLWVENVTIQGSKGNDWGRVYNAAQFLPEPIQNRNRIVGGVYPEPVVFHSYRKAFKGVCPCITATEYKGCASDSRRASRFYGRRLSIDECAYHQGFEIPDTWRTSYNGFTKGEWNRELYTAIGNGVPVYMAYAFGLAASDNGIPAL
jgi:site-specific DNA-cytosine methylase